MVEKTSEIELNQNQLAKAAGMSTKKLDKLLVNGKESQKKIIQCYKGLVVSVAASYQGKGLSLQDLIQVLTFFSVIWFYCHRNCVFLWTKVTPFVTANYRKEA